MLRRPEAAGSRVRLLLLGRSNSFWAPLAQILDRAGIAVSERVLGELPEGGTARAEMFDAALAAFACMPEVGGGHVSVGEVARPDLGAEGFALSLAVQMAALVAALRAADDEQDAGQGIVRELLSDPAAVSRELLVREITHWERLRGRNPSPLTVSS